MMEAATPCDGRPSFAHERHAGLLLWWAEGKWWVGKREELGQVRIGIRVRARVRVRARARVRVRVIH